MTVFKKSLAVFLALITAFSTMAFSVSALDLCYYTVETYFMNTRGAYGVQPDESVHKYATAGTDVEIKADEFEGFTLDSSKSDNVIEVKDDGSSVAKIYYQRNMYNLTYYYEDLLGPQTEDAKVYFGAEIPGFEANPSGKPAKKGYDFIMWSTSPENKVEAPEVMPANDVDLYPIYEVKTYTYTFNAGEGGLFPNGQQVLTFEYAYGEAPEIPAIPAMEHYEFNGWDNDIPQIVESNMTFCAEYKELTYVVVFMNGEEELSYFDGYRLGDIIEEVDVPDGFEAWTLSDGTYVQFPYEIKGDTYLYAAEAPVKYSAKFYTDVNDSEPYAVFTAFAGSEIEFPEAPARKGYKFIGWTSDITIMPDEDIDFIAEWEELGSELPEDYLGLRTELYTYNEEIGDWVVADRVERGEKVKARFFIESGFGIGDGQVLFFYNDEAFESDYAGYMSPVVINESETSATGQYPIEGSVTSPLKSNPFFSNLIMHGYLPEGFMDNHTPVIMSFRFSDFTCHNISGDEWFAEFELTAKSDAVGKGDFFIVPETIDRPAVGNKEYYGYITFTIGKDGESSIDDNDSLMNFAASLFVESNPVSTGYGRLILDAGEGVFADGSSVTKLDFVAGSQIEEYSEPTREGYIFDGYEPEIPVTIDDEVIKVVAKWAPAEDTPYKIIVHYVDVYDGESFEYEEEIEFEGVTGYTVEIVEALPESPEYDTEYILVEDLAMNDYNIVDFAAENVVSAVIAADGSTVLEIFFKLASYEVEFYADEGSFPNGSNIVSTEAVYGTLASSIVPADEPRRRGFIFAGWHGIDETEFITEDTVYYALWEPEKSDFTVYFVATGDVPEGFILPEAFIATEGEFIIVPEKYSAEGYEFDGWYYNGTRYDYGSQLLMPSENITLICKWKRTAVETTTQPVTTEPIVTEPIVTETTTTKPTTTKPVVTETTTTKPTTTEPVVTETSTIKPTTTEPVVTEITTTKPTTTKPVVTETTTTKPTTTKPVVTETTTTKPTTTKPVVTETTTTKPTTTKPVVTETTTTKPTTTKPVVTEPTTKPQTFVFEIRNPTVTTINYGDSIILHADVIEGELPKDAKIVWSADNGNFKIVSTAEDGTNCMVTPNSKGDTVFTVTILDKDGNEIARDTQKMTSKAGFFQKLIAFFKKIFGLTKVIPEAIRPVFEK